MGGLGDLAGAGEGVFLGGGLGDFSFLGGGLGLGVGGFTGLGGGTGSGLGASAGGSACSPAGWQGTVHALLSTWAGASSWVWPMSAWQGGAIPCNPDRQSFNQARRASRPLTSGPGAGAKIGASSGLQQQCGSSDGGKVSKGAPRGGGCVLSNKLLWRSEHPILRWSQLRSGTENTICEIMGCCIGTLPGARSSCGRISRNLPSRLSRQEQQRRERYAKRPGTHSQAPPNRLFRSLPPAARNMYSFWRL